MPLSALVLIAALLILAVLLLVIALILAVLLILLVLTLLVVHDLTSLMGNSGIVLPVSTELYSFFKGLPDQQRKDYFQRYP